MQIFIKALNFLLSSAPVARLAMASARIWAQRGLWMRAFLCWMIGTAFLLSNDHANYDWRLQIRPAKKPQENIILLETSEREWEELTQTYSAGNTLKRLKEIHQETDSTYWQAVLWRKVLAKLLLSDPRAVAMLFYFGDEAKQERVGSAAVSDPFVDPRVIWSADIDASGRLLWPGLAVDRDNNVAIKNLRSDDDGILRRVNFSHYPHVSILNRLEEMNDGSNSLPREIEHNSVIDFAGPAGTFPSVSVQDFLSDSFNPDIFKDQIVLIGPKDPLLAPALTPLGRMSRAEIFGNVLHSQLGNRWIRQAPLWVYSLMLLLILIFSIWILSTYPQSVALAFFACMTLIWTSASAWAFDSEHVWIPVLAPLIQIIATYMVFLSYQLARNEQKAWRLEQERRNLSELESLKNNFVSMMSHDLKTPIAKIQAIASRTQSLRPHDTEMAEILQTSEELNRYIRSILQVTKLEARDFQIRLEPVDINLLIEKVKTRLSPLAREKQISIESNLEPLFSIEADSILIQEIIQNLVENAIKYTPEKGLVRIESKERDDKIVVSVEDTGPGIDLVEQKEIWGKFIRGRKLTQMPGGPSGTGLGLYLVKYFVELHGGEVFLQSRLGQGCRFGFSLPILHDQLEAKT